jgi:hypothetical protein
MPGRRASSAAIRASARKASDHAGILPTGWTTSRIPFSATLAFTPLGWAGRGVTTALVLAPNAPDLDITGVRGGASH